MPFSRKSLGNPVEGPKSGRLAKTNSGLDAWTDVWSVRGPGHWSRHHLSSFQRPLTAFAFAVGPDHSSSPVRQFCGELGTGREMPCGFVPRLEPWKLKAPRSSGSRKGAVRESDQAQTTH